MAKRCSACGRQAEGRFCSYCGAPLEAATCRSCGAELPAGARFCNRCGAPVAVGGQVGPGAPVVPRAGVGPESSASLGWWIAGAAMVILILVLALPIVRERRGGGEPAVSGPPPAPLDLADVSPREAADRLFNRVMQAVSAGDSTEAKFFLPMAIEAYQQVGELDADGYYHLSLLQRTGGQADSALTSAERILEAQPTHLLGLAAAAEAALDLGEEGRAREYYRRLVESYDAEVAKNLPEYEAHWRQLAQLLEEAKAFLSPGR